MYHRIRGIAKGGGPLTSAPGRVAMIAGSATLEGTTRYRERFRDRAAAGHFREVRGLWLSSIGLGTYLGEADAATDEAYEEAILAGLAAGSNVIDTAVNYRHQRSERAVGRALARAFRERGVRRDEVFVATKGGFLPFDGDLPGDPRRFLQETYLASGLLQADDLAGGVHAMSPGFLADQLERSRRNLGLATLDLYYLHNPETQLGDLPRERFRERLREAVGALEGAVREGKAAGWGIATWDGLRAGPRAPEHLSLAEVAEIAAQVARGSRSGRFMAVQLPFNLAMPEALASPSQPYQGATVPALVAARALGLAVFTSASLLQGRLAGGLPDEIAAAFPEPRTDAQRALQFARSAPGVTVALVGASQAEHVRENLELAAIPPADPAAFQRLFLP